MIKGVEETKWILPDVEKLVGTFYFACILFAIATVLLIPTRSITFAKYLSSFTSEVPTVIFIMQALFVIGVVAIGLVIRSNLLKLVGHSAIVTVYWKGKLANLENNTFLDAIKNEMDVGDWASADTNATNLEFVLTGVKYRRTS